MSPTQKENPKNTVVKIFASIAVFIGVAVFAFGVPEEGGCGREVGLDEAGLAQSSEGQAFMPHDPIGQIVCCKCTTGNGKLVWRAGTPKPEETPIQLCAGQAGGNGCINGTKVTTCPPGFCVGDNCLGTSVTNESGHTSTDLQGTSGSGRGNSSGGDGGHGDAAFTQMGWCVNAACRCIHPTVDKTKCVYSAKPKESFNRHCSKLIEEARKKKACTSESGMMQSLD